MGAGLFISTATDLSRIGDTIHRVEGGTEPDPHENISGDDMQPKRVIIARTTGIGINFAGVPVESFVPEPLRNWKPPAGAGLNSRYARLSVPAQPSQDLREGTWMEVGG